MRRVERIPESVFNPESSSIDTNRFYSILLDAKAATVSENMCDITEKLLHGEKENAKGALEQLWNLKKNLFSQSSGTLDMVISFYQDKINILRNKEEHIKKISKDSRNLLEEKRRRDEEIASVKQQIEECSKEIQDLTVKLNKLQVKEQELILIEQQLKKELHTNENEIVNGLYEIILSQQEREMELRKFREQDPSLPVSLAPIPKLAYELNEDDSYSDGNAVTDDDERKSSDVSIDILKKTDSITREDLITPADIQEPEPSLGVASQTETLEQVQAEQVPQVENVEYMPQQDQLDIPIYPKSVVKTTNGRVIGEYFYDARVYKNERHYIFNSKFFAERLCGDIKFLRQKFDQAVYSEVMQMINQAYKRVTENKMFHFEISTNEILNDRNLKTLWQSAKIRNIDEVEKFCSRLKAKIDALGNNYKAMLQEQMKRCIGQ
jgi:hypothetical protein